MSIGGPTALLGLQGGGQQVRVDGRASRARVEQGEMQIDERGRCVAFDEVLALEDGHQIVTVGAHAVNGAVDQRAGEPSGGLVTGVAGGDDLGE